MGDIEGLEVGGDMSEIRQEATKTAQCGAIV